MRKLRTKLAGVAGIFTVALGVGLAAAGPASAGTSGPNGCSVFGYQDANYGCVSVTTVDNANWTIVNSTLTVQAAPGFGYGGWVDTFTYTQKTGKGSHAGQSSSTGTVTDTTPYGTSTAPFTDTTGTQAPFSFTGGQVATNDDYAIAHAQYDMVYFNGGQNAYWFYPPQPSP